MRSTDLPPKTPLPRRIFGVFAQQRTYLNLLYAALALPLGIAYFVALVTLIATGAGMAVTLVGLPLLVLTIYGWCWLADTDRLLTNSLLGTRIRPLDFSREQGMSWGLARLWSRLRNPATWRAGVYLFLRFPQGIIIFAVVGGLLAQAAWGIAIPFCYTQVSSDASNQYASLNYGVFTVDSIGKALIVTAFSPLCLLLAVHLSNLFAWVSGKLAAELLGGEGELPARGPLNPAISATVNWPGMASAQAHTPARSRTRYLQTRAVLWHAAFFGVMTVLFLAITAAATPGEWWAVWPIWALAMPLGLHVGYYLRGGWGAHAGLFAVVILGLFAINMRFSATVWFYWPLLAWGAILAFHWWLSTRIGLEHEREAASYAYAGLAPAQPPAPSPFDAPRPGNTDGPDLPTPPASAANPGISVDVAMRVVRVGGQEIEVTRREFDLLALFVSNPGRPFGRDELLDRIWKNDYDVTERTIDTHIQRLRRKLGDHADAIQTVWGVGYRFVRDEE
ncbi:MAG TPA: sensor domain-containing protein [Tepidiformaceae bacterium]|nr:sensor domain-containing protein [Tepidiformaceae bacterium]